MKATKDSVRGTLRSMRWLLLLGMALLAACGGANKESEPAPAAQSSQPSSAQAPEPASEEPAEQKRVVEHDGGTTTIVGEPDKIAVLDYRLADTLLALGITPYAMGTYLGGLELPYVDGDPFAGAIPLGDTPNIEAVLEAEPDLILTRSADALDQLDKIAPAIVAGAAGKFEDWKDGFREIAGYLNKESEAESWLADFRQRADALRAELDGTIEPDATFLYLRVMPKEIRVHGVNQALAQTLFGELGLKPVPGLENVARIEAISLEALPNYDADYIFMEVGAPGNTDARNNLSLIEESAVWQNLKAVRGGHVYETPQWIISDFPYIKLKSLDVIREALIGSPDDSE